MVELPKGKPGVRVGWWMWRRQVFVCCQKCGTAASLEHEIVGDGTVTPSVECAVLGCGFHEQVRLLDWSPP